MRSIALAFFVAASFFLGFPPAAHAQDAATTATKHAPAENKDQFATLRKQIQQALDESGAPSVSVAVAQNGKIVFDEAFGWADIERKIPATPDTMYSLASITKPMTETALMILVERGKLDLNAPVNDYLAPDAQMNVWIGDAKDVTVQRVIDHRAGLARHEHFYGADKISKMTTMDESIRRYGNIVTLPGERYRYSNFGYGILSHIIERISDESYADFMRKELFLPLGMTHSSVGIAPDLAEYAAVRYDDKNREIPYYSFDHDGASGAWTSARDLALFGTFMLGKPAAGQKAILSGDMVTAMNIRASTGGMGGVYTMLRTSPEQGLAVAVVCNKFCYLPDTVNGLVMTAMVPGYAERMANRQRRPRGNQSGRGGQPAEFQTPPELLGDWEGLVHTYDGDYPMSLSFKESGEIVAKLEKQLPTIVVDARYSDAWFFGNMAGRIDTTDTRMNGWEPEHHIELDLKLRGDTITGAVTTIAGNALSHWVELKKKTDAPE